MNYFPLLQEVMFVFGIISLVSCNQQNTLCHASYLFLSVAVQFENLVDSVSN
jgi:hypothetical protein